MEIRPIDANALLEGIEELKRSPWYNGENGNYERLVRNDAIGTVIDLCIKSAPTLDYAPVRHGEWIPLEETQWNCFGLVTIGYRCSECGREEPHNNEPYCHCGAKMDGGEKDV